MPHGNADGPRANLGAFDHPQHDGRPCAVPLAVWLVLAAPHRRGVAPFVAAGLSDVILGRLGGRSGRAARSARCSIRSRLVTMYVTLAANACRMLAILVVFRDTTS